MNKVLLINRLNPNDESDNKRHIFFLIGDMNVSKIENSLIDIINKSHLVEDSNDILYKYNGVELNIPIHMIPTIIGLFASSKISVYGVYEIYNPDF